MAHIEDRTERRCENCQATTSEQYCGRCGSKMDQTSNPYKLAAESIFKFSSTKEYCLLYGRILKSPTRNTIRSFETGRPSDGIRFLEYSVAVYLLAIAVSGLTLFSNNEIVKVLTQSIWLFVTFSVSYTLYYLAMRNAGSRRRTAREYMFFGCLTLGFTLPIGILQFTGIVGSLALLILTVPMCLYIIRSWKYFWGASGARVFWSLYGCTMAGGMAGLLILAPVWLIFGLPQ